jgi:hypothetical protein
MQTQFCFDKDKFLASRKEYINSNRGPANYKQVDLKYHKWKESSSNFSGRLKYILDQAGGINHPPEVSSLPDVDRLAENLAEIL